jgi:tetratricopeptide (TPR) repeat protein
MKSNSTVALALLLGGALVATVPAAARPKQQPAATPAPAGPVLSAAERAALLPVNNAAVARDWAAANAALPAAQAAVQGPDAKYFLGQLMVTIGAGTNSDPLQAQGVDMMLASGAAPPNQLHALYQNQAVLGVRLRNPKAAEAGFGKLLEMNPGDTESMINLAKVEIDLRRPAQAVDLIERAIAAKRAAGQAVDQNWYRYALRTAFEAKLAAPSLRLAREMVAAYPTRENWRDALLVYRDLTTLDKGTTLDLLRLLRATKALAGERDWFDLADQLNNGGLPGETKAVLQEAAAMHQVDLAKPGFADLMRTASVRVAADRASLPGLETRAMAAPTGQMALSTADAYYGYGEYAKAAALYRAALSKGGIDPNVADLRLGMSLAATGDRAGAETAFRAVAGPRADIAGFWLAWLATPAAA